VAPVLHLRPAERMAKCFAVEEEAAGLVVQGKHVEALFTLIRPQRGRGDC
jgi:hypothetical protein